MKKLSSPRDSYFGTSVAVSGDLALVGTDKEAAYMYGRNQGGANAWGLVKTFTPPFQSSGNFGSKVAIAGTTVVLGAPLCTPIYGPGIDVAGAGAVFVYSRNQGGQAAWGLVKKLISPDVYRSRHFGYSVAISGDVILAGSPPEFQDGSACFFERNRGGANAWGAAVLWHSDDGTFGQEAAIQGDAAIVGQNKAAFVFRLVP